MVVQQIWSLAQYRKVGQGARYITSYKIWSLYKKKIQQILMQKFFCFWTKILIKSLHFHVRMLWTLYSYFRNSLCKHVTSCELLVAYRNNCIFYCLQYIKIAWTLQQVVNNKIYQIKTAMITSSVFVISKKCAKKLSLKGQVLFPKSWYMDTLVMCMYQSNTFLCFCVCFRDKRNVLTDAVNRTKTSTLINTNKCAIYFVHIL